MIPQENDLSYSQRKKGCKKSLPERMNSICKGPDLGEEHDTFKRVREEYCRDNYKKNSVAITEEEWAFTDCNLKEQTSKMKKRGQDECLFQYSRVTSVSPHIVCFLTRQRAPGRLIDLKTLKVSPAPHSSPWLIPRGGESNFLWLHLGLIRRQP
ncbi:unnamed protein product [Rangifer tarandus platyrhynchus]|uniref:Uncharacterized protein n=2 Tax=Rangifer tarandus platyrhynchus TaxID=3082113 RepID=A0AC59Y286_RANTA|nr:unnamed protein product [Rangifer tarandus platyrhynchus]